MSLRIEALIADRERAEQRDADRIRAFVVEQLQHEATHARQDSARVRALELLGKLSGVGAFKDVVQTDIADSRGAAEIESELRETLVALLAEDR